jgi:hypothetical protein
VQILTEYNEAIHGIFNGLCLCPQQMLKRKLFFSGLLVPILIVGTATTANAQQQRRGETEAVRDATMRGAIQSLRQIEANVVPAMKRRGADYIGAEFDGGALRYRLKFVRQSSVIWIDVDGRSGAIIAQAGN